MMQSRIDVNADELAAALGRANLSQSSVANALGVSQSQISRVLSGHASMRSKLAQDLCSYVFSMLLNDVGSRVQSNADLMSAIAQVWDGTPAHARALATVIRSLGCLSPAASAARKRR